MDKALLARELDIVKNLPPGETFEFTIEGAGILQAFVRARSQREDAGSAEKALHTKINTLLVEWNKRSNRKSAKPQTATADNRTQLILREAIDRVQKSRFDQITQEEIKLLRATSEVFDKRNFSKDNPNSRLNALLKATLEQLRKHQSELVGIDDHSLFDTTHAAGASELPEGIINELMAAETFSDIQKTAMLNLEEIELDIKVRVFEYDGETAIFGDMPSDVLVKVTNAGITVNGFVSGYIAAENDIVVNGNIQGGALI